MALKGSLDGHTFTQLEQDMQQLLQPEINHLVIELAELTYIASSGIGTLISANQTVNQRGGKLHLVKPTAMVREVFNILGLAALFPIHETTAEALAAIG